MLLPLQRTRPSRRGCNPRVPWAGSLSLGRWAFKMPPDFSALFRRDTVAPLHFRVRDGAFTVHDVQFLSSYLHDARFMADAVMHRRRKLTIMLERDCWELGYTERTGSLELHVARSRLTIAPVSGYRWQIRDVERLQRELWIQSIYLDAVHWETADASELVVSAPHAGWKLSVAIADHCGDIRLDDQETPYLLPRERPNQAMPFRQAQGPEPTEGQPTPKAFGVADLASR